ncbi:hypothetical protein OSB04_002482 [Centaurea solstitialis]|uniref:Uncharacterized protein n=1 Tax=Centaurea solstitialis TaxID=347529 RepID=A0AA38U3K3_9ASTR|nr:hypothetical protein OSB04_002482 [Centaurea solstitialis]
MEDNDDTMFMVHNTQEFVVDDTWYVNCGCSNHMSLETRTSLSTLMNSEKGSKDMMTRGYICKEYETSLWAKTMGIKGYQVSTMFSPALPTSAFFLIAALITAPPLLPDSCPNQLLPFSILSIQSRFSLLSFILSFPLLILMVGGDKNIIQPLHPATTVTNIRNQIPITLTTDGNTYNSWVALFKVQCTVCKVLDHIIPDATAPSDHDEEWKRIDAIVLQWIYSTISTDLLTTILNVDNTAAKA